MCHCIISLYLIKIMETELLLPVVYRDSEDDIQEVASMPGVARYGINKLRQALEPMVQNGLKCVLIFGVPSKLPKVSDQFLKVYDYIHMCLNYIVK